MIATNQASWLVLALIGITSSCWYFAREPVLYKLDPYTLSNTTDMMAHHLTVHQYDTRGHLAHYLQTPFMHHIPSNNTHWLKKPHVVITEEDQPAWEIHAEHATALYGGQQITFNRQVVIHQKESTHSKESTFKTESITYFPKDKLAQTLLDITYEQPGHMVKAQGMNAYLAEKRIQLLNHAHAIFEAQHG